VTIFVPWHAVKIDRLSVPSPRDSVGRWNRFDKALDVGGVFTPGRLLGAADDDWRAVAQQVHVT